MTNTFQDFVEQVGSRILNAIDQTYDLASEKLGDLSEFAEKLDDKVQAAEEKTYSEKQPEATFDDWLKAQQDREQPIERDNQESKTWAANSDDVRTTNIRLINAAIIGGYPIEFKYLKYGSPTPEDRTLKVESIDSVAGLVKGIDKDSREYRSFRLDRIQGYVK